MKKILLTLGILTLTFLGCGEKKKEIKPDASSDNIALGENLFNKRTCTNCHSLDNNTMGPSIKEIVKIYSEQNKNIIDFLKGELNHPIVEKDSNQVAVMRENVENFVKDLSNEELQAISSYMLDVGK